MQYALVLIVLVNIIFVSGEQCNPKDCTNYKIQEHYRDIKCEPVYDKNNKCCPFRYDCPVIEQMLTQQDKCHYRGHLIEQGASLKELEGSNCDISYCFCNRIGNERAAFACASPLCAGPAHHSEKFCREKNTLGQCCPEQICGEDPNTLKNCTLEGNQYISGQRMYPQSDKCQECVCKDDGTKECRHVTCNLQIRAVDKILDFCAPVYYGKEGCCPTDFICPNELIRIDRKNNTNTDKKKMCKFGTELLQIGDEMSQRGRYCLSCRCETPPMVTCISSPRCRP